MDCPIVIDDTRYVTMEAVNEVPAEQKIFNQEQSNYVKALARQVLLNDMKGKLLNIIEGIGLPDRQETAIKRMVTNELHEMAHHLGECMDLVIAD